jgi:hypothetical protein
MEIIARIKQQNPTANNRKRAIATPIVNCDRSIQQQQY